jgi:hypothetical protein
MRGKTADSDTGAALKKQAVETSKKLKGFSDEAFDRVYIDQHLTVLGAPSNLGLKPPSSGKEPGVRYMVHVLREHGLVSRLHAEDAGTVTPPKSGSTIDPSTNIRNASAIREYSIQLADRLGSSLDERRFLLFSGAIAASFWKRVSASQAGATWSSLYRRT